MQTLLNPRKMLLVDGVGALLSAILLGFVLIKFNIGLPIRILNLLSIIASTFAIYSISCYLFVKQNTKRFLFAIATANLMYCLLTLVYVIVLNHRLTTLGLVYFIGEMLVIVTLATIEFKIALKK